MPIAPAVPTPLIIVPEPDGPTAAPTVAVPVATPTPETGWQTLGDGLSRRIDPILNADGVEVDRMMILRIDPALYQFDVAYQPREPKSLIDWSEETGALITVNGGFFTADYDATGLTIVDGVVHGWSYTYGGMVVIQNESIRVRSMAREPYQPGEPIDAGLQAFPLLVHPDGSGYTQESTNRARRTVIAQDNDGHILLIVTERSYFTLTEISEYLRSSDLDLHIALNLDGATSTGLILRDPYYAVPAFVLLPTVLTVTRR